MTDHVWVGGAPAVAQVSKITLPTDIDAGQVFNATIGRKTLSYTFITGETRLTAAAAIVSAWNLSDIPEFAEVTAFNNGDGSFNLTADEEGIPFIVTTQIGSSTNEVQVITVSGATGGTFTLTYDGQTTGNIAYNASAGTVDTALEALSNIGSGDVSVTGSAGGPWTVEFTGSLAATNVEPITADTTNLTGFDNEEQTVTLINSPTGGDFTLSYLGQETAAIAYNAAASAVEDALEGLANILVGDVSVSGSAGGPWTVEFTGELAKTDVNMLVADSSLTGAPTCAAATTQAGSGLNIGDLKAYWTMDEASGTREDYTGSFDLTENGTVSLASGIVNGGVDGFSASNYLDVAHSTALVPSGSFSITAWIRPNTASLSSINYILSKGLITALQDSFSLYQYNTNIIFDFETAAGAEDITSSTEVADDGWYFVVAVADFENSKIKISINGETYQEAAITAASAIVDGGTHLTIGIAENTAGNYIYPYLGNIDEVGIWPKALSQSEVTTLYNSGSGLQPPFTGTNEIQTLTFTGTPSAGSVGVSFAGEEALIPYDSTAAEAEALLEALSTIGSGNVSVTGGDWPGTALTVEFVEDLGQSDQPLFVVDNTQVHVTVAEATKGIPHPTISIDTTGGPIDVTTVTANSGPNDFNTAANWNTETVPTGSDNIFIVDGDNILYGLDQSGVTFGTIQIYNSETEIGLPRRNDDYYEYRTRFLTIGGATTIIIGLGEGNGSDRINLDIGTSSPNITVYNSGSGDGGETAVQIVGENSSNTAELLVLAGEVGIALFPDDAAYFNKLTQRNGSLRLGQDITVKELIVTGGSITSDRTTLDGATTL